MAPKINNKLLKLIVFVENAFCAYRNYCCYLMFGRIMITTRILFEFSFIIACGVTCLNVYKEHTKIALFYLNISSNILIIILAWYNSEKFKFFLKYAENIDAYFDTDKEYVKNLDKKYKIVVFMFIVITVLVAIVICYNAPYYYKNINYYKYFLIASLRGICLIRYIFEYIVLACVLFILSEQVKCIIRKISKEKLVHIEEAREEGASRSNIEEPTGEIASFDELTAVYTNIKECSILINSIFGVQITTILTLLIFYFIVLLYGVSVCVIKEHCDATSFLTYFTKLVIYLTGLYVFSRGAQAAQNSSNDLRCCLARLLIHSTTNIQLYKPTKDFLRLVSSRPIETHAFGSINIDMSLLPKFVMFFTSYTVIALQFNNVL